MFSKQITQKIIECWGFGYTAEETRDHLVKNCNIRISLHTVYNHRRSLTAQNLIDELIRRQECAIVKADSAKPALAMKYRNELLKILVPQRIEQNIKQETRSLQIVRMWQPDDTANSNDNLKVLSVQPPSKVPPGPLPNTA